METGPFVSDHPGECVMDLVDLIWLFPVVFMLHDFEELLLMESWLEVHGQDLLSSLPAWAESRLGSVLQESPAEFGTGVLVLFLLAAVSSALAALEGILQPFLVTASAFVVHAAVHVVQAVVLRRYVPALFTSVILILPYGMFLYGKLISAGAVSGTNLALYQVVGLALIFPLITGSRALGRLIYARLNTLIGG